MGKMGRIETAGTKETTTILEYHLFSVIPAVFVVFVVFIAS